MQTLTERERQFVGLAFFVQGDRFANVIDHHLAGIAPGHMFLEFVADGWVHRAIHVLVEHFQQFFALHSRTFTFISEPQVWKKLQTVCSARNHPSIYPASIIAPCTATQIPPRSTNDPFIHLRINEGTGAIQAARTGAIA
jgi:hypothetical protein